MYKTIVAFVDLTNGHRYEKGDAYPVEGYEPTEARIKELSSKNNKRGVALIEKVEVKAKKKK